MGRPFLLRAVPIGSVVARRRRRLRDRVTQRLRVTGGQPDRHRPTHLGTRTFSTGGVVGRRLLATDVATARVLIVTLGRLAQEALTAQSRSPANNQRFRPASFARYKASSARFIAVA